MSKTPQQLYEERVKRVEDAIQLKTPENGSCSACHGNRDIFLTDEDVRPEEREANKDVIVPEIP